MRDLIPLREIIKEIQQNVHSANLPILQTSTLSKAFNSIPQSTVFEDNKSCLRLASLGKMSPRTKHIAIPYHFFRSKGEELEIKVISIDTKEQLADQFTKGLPEQQFIILRKPLCGWSLYLFGGESRYPIIYDIIIPGIQSCVLICT